MRLALACSALAALTLLVGLPQGARAQAAFVVSDCSAVTGIPTGGGQPLVEDTTGKLCGLQAGSAPTTPTYVVPGTATATDKGGTITVGGTAQTAIAANTARKGWCIQNDPAATETLYVRVNGTASATAGMALSPGQQACNPSIITDTALVSVFGATTSHRWFGTEWQ